MSKSPIIIDDEPISSDPADWLPNPHAGEALRSDFLEPLELEPADIARLVGIDSGRVSDVISGQKRMDAELDLRLGRYSGMSDGFFLRLQVAHELLEQRRALGSALGEIIPRAA